MDADPPDGGLRARLRRRPIPERTSEVLRDLAEGGETERITFREVLTELKHRAVGFALLIFALPCILPMPPGIPTVAGIALVIISVHLLTARQRLWLPSAIADKSIGRADLKRMVERAVPYLERLEKVCKPRLPIVTETVGKVLIGVVIFALGFIMILPIPFLGNMPPGFAATVIAIGMTERDGLVVLIGTVASAAAVALASFVTTEATIKIIDFFSS
ncbi:MAG TPA: exopolysaccharide biosynthesis protein [Gammaproteobacteria bacterium]